MTTTQIDTDRSLLHIMGLWSKGGEGRVERGGREALTERRERERENEENLCHCVSVSRPLHVVVGYVVRSHTVDHSLTGLTGKLGWAPRHGV